MSQDGKDSQRGASVSQHDMYYARSRLCLFRRVSTADRLVSFSSLWPGGAGGLSDVRVRVGEGSSQRLKVKGRQQ